MMEVAFPAASSAAHGLPVCAAPRAASRGAPRPLHCAVAAAGAVIVSRMRRSGRRAQVKEVEMPLESWTLLKGKSHVNDFSIFWNFVATILGLIPFRSLQ
jgi:hypothetical protein